MLKRSRFGVEQTNAIVFAMLARQVMNREPFPIARHGRLMNSIEIIRLTRRGPQHHSIIRIAQLSDHADTRELLLGCPAIGIALLIFRFDSEQQKLITTERDTIGRARRQFPTLTGATFLNIPEFRTFARCDGKLITLFEMANPALNGNRPGGTSTLSSNVLVAAFQTFNFQSELWPTNTLPSSDQIMRDGERKPWNERMPNPF